MLSRKNSIFFFVFLFLIILFFSNLNTFAQSIPRADRAIGGRVHWVYDGSFCPGQGGLPPFNIEMNGTEEGPFAYTILQLYRNYMPFIPNIWAIFNASRIKLPLCVKVSGDPPSLRPVFVYPVTLPGIGSSLTP